MTYFLAYVINGFCNIIIMAIVLQAIMSWFVPSLPDILRRIYFGLVNITEPFIRPFRMLTQRFTYSMGIDFSPILAIMAIELIDRILIGIIFRF